MQPGDDCGGGEQAQPHGQQLPELAAQCVAEQRWIRDRPERAARGQRSLHQQLTHSAAAGGEATRAQQRAGSMVTAPRRPQRQHEHRISRPVTIPACSPASPPRPRLRRREPDRVRDHREGAGPATPGDPHPLSSFAPLRHFTDHKIRVHLFTCVLALSLSLAHLMRRKCTRAGLSLSVPALLAELEGIGETVLLYQGERGRSRTRHTITKTTPTQQRLYEVFNLDRYTPKR